MAGRTLKKPQAESWNIRLEQKESNFCFYLQKTEKLTIEEVRSFKGFETVSESEGQEIIESLFGLAVIVYNF